MVDDGMGLDDLWLADLLRPLIMKTGRLARVSHLPLRFRIIFFLCVSRDRRKSSL